MMSSSVSLGERPAWSAPEERFATDVWTGTGPIRDLYGYDVAADGETFTLIDTTNVQMSYVVTVNWPELLRRRLEDAERP